MKNTLCALTTAAALLFAPVMIGAAPALAATALCKDGTQYNGSSNRGACGHHGGVQQWLNVATAQTTQPPAANNAPAAVPAIPVPQPATPQVNPAPRAAAPNNLAVANNATGQVWVNLKSKVYHCAGDRYYGKTKSGEFLPESQAVAQGFRPDHGKACGQA